jgi:hypothetical protein
MKTCTSCRLDKPLSEFYPRSDGTGYRSRCRQCNRRSPEQNERRRERHAERPERHVLETMIQRCHNPKNPSYPDYGARCITVCAAWRNSFDAFFAHVGPRPSPAHMIERGNNAVGYEPGNVRWATRTEQNRNTRQNVLITVGDRTQCRTEWSGETGVPANVIRDRMEKLGWSAERAVFTPVRAQRRRAA